MREGFRTGESWRDSRAAITGAGRQDYLIHRKSLGNPGCKIRRFDGLTGSPGESQKEGQEDQGGIKELEGTPP